MPIEGEPQLMNSEDRASTIQCFVVVICSCVVLCFGLASSKGCCVDTAAATTEQASIRAETLKAYYDAAAVPLLSPDQIVTDTK